MITSFLTVPNFFKLRILAVNAASPFAINTVRTITDLSLLVFWGAAFICMVLPKGKDERYGSSMPPYGPWAAATTLAAIEWYVFIRSYPKLDRKLTSPRHHSVAFANSAILITREIAAREGTELAAWIW
ncbi:hypothetical protein MMC07_004236 [Pseudocyphellaria aurata]|nr:hypothetical protein [Pseudocyphellaria aurata]